LELLLNLFWLLLIGPGVYLWLRERRRAKWVFQFSMMVTVPFRSLSQFHTAF
jgi:hypothetical protein